MSELRALDGVSSSTGRTLSGGAIKGRVAKRQTGSHARADGTVLKLHRRLLRADGHTYTVVGLRPGTAVRFSVNRFHDMWHVLSDPHGARVLGRLLWGLSYQRVPDTLVVVDREFLTPTPFEADPPVPIVLVPEPLTAFGTGAARALRRALPQTGPPDGTVRWRTPGLDEALADPRAWLAAQPPTRFPQWRNLSGYREDAVSRAGLLTVAAPAARLREWAVSVSQLGQCPGPTGMDYEFLPGDTDSLEVQVFEDFATRVSCAVEARTRVEAELRADDDADPDAEGVRRLVWERGTDVRRQRTRGRRRPPRNATAATPSRRT